MADIEAGTERAQDLMLVEVAAEAEAIFEQWYSDFKGRRLAHVEARPHPQAPPQGTPAAAQQMQPGQPPATLTPKNGGY